MSTKPHIGMIVLLHQRDHKPLPALIVALRDDECADVAAFDPGAQLPFHNVPPIWLEPDAERCWGLLQSE